jgi:hypothetical protein
MHCPEPAPPSISFLGTVVSSGGKLNSGMTLLYYDLLTTVYDRSAKAQTSFTIRIYFKNGRRWANFPLLTLQTCVIIAGHICGMTSTEHLLAVLVDDVHFVPGSPLGRVASPQTPQSTSAKQTPQNRWGRRAAVRMGTEPVTPSRKRRHVPDSDLAEVDMQLTASSASLATPSVMDEADNPEDKDDNVEADDHSTTTDTSWPSTPVGPVPVLLDPLQDQRPRRVRRTPNN